MSTPAIANLAPLEEFLSQRSHIRHVTPSSPEYPSIRESYMIDETLNPPMIVRPQSSDDVAELVSTLTSYSIPFTVRSGGHELHNRTFARNAVAIDMRDIAHVNIDKGSLTARVGGGIIMKYLVAQLDKEGLVTPTGTIQVVGYVGWAIHGGYGLHTPTYGLGADQIVGAKLVNGDGKVIDADEKLLEGIRGGGGAFGVIVELTVKVYELTSVLGGMIFMESTDIASTVKRYNDAVRTLAEEGLPSALGLFQAVVDTPNGKMFGTLFLWNSTDLEAGEFWLKKICSIAPVAMNTVAKTTLAGWLEQISSVVPHNVFGTVLFVSFENLTPEVVDVLARYAEKMPSGTGAGYSLHQLRAKGVEEYPESVVPERRPHYMLEIQTVSPSKEPLEKLIPWGREFREAVLKTDPKNLLRTLYLPFAVPETLNLLETFGEQRYEVMADLKRTYDPKNVFSHALAQF